MSLYCSTSAKVELYFEMATVWMVFFMEVSLVWRSPGTTLDAGSFALAKGYGFVAARFDWVFSVVLSDTIFFSFKPMFWSVAAWSNP